MPNLVTHRSALFTNKKQNKKNEIKQTFRERQRTMKSSLFKANQPTNRQRRQISPALASVVKADRLIERSCVTTIFVPLLKIQRTCCAYHFESAANRVYLDDFRDDHRPNLLETTQARTKTKPHLESVSLSMIILCLQFIFSFLHNSILSIVKRKRFN